MIQEVALVFPSTSVDSVESYMQSKGVVQYNIFTNTDDFLEFADSIKGVHMMGLWIFDFMCVSTLYPTFLKVIDGVQSLQVVTNSRNIADQFKQHSPSVFYVKQLFDITQAFWDNEVFSCLNIAESKKTNIPIIAKNIEIPAGIHVNKVDVHYEVKKISTGNKSVYQLDVTSNMTGEKQKAIQTERDTNFKKFKEVLTDRKNWLFMTPEEYQETKSSKLDMVMSTAIKIKNTDIPRTMEDLLLGKKVISAEEHKKLISLQKNGTISGPWAVIDWAIENGKVSPGLGMNYMNELYNTYFVPQETVMTSDIILTDNLPLSKCREYCALTVKGQSTKRNYVLIGFNYHTEKREATINQFLSHTVFLPTRDEYIFERLDKEISPREGGA